MAEPAHSRHDDPAPNRRLENLTLWQRVYEHLREDILGNRLPPGTELNEVALAQELGVSRGPIRESLGRLAAEGLVVVRPRRGAVVRSLSHDEFVDAYQLREALEALAVRLAVPRLSPETLARLHELTEAMAEHAAAGAVDPFFDANAAFHELLISSSGNRKLQEVYGQLLGQMGRYRTRSMTLRGNLHRSVTEHRAILRALQRGDADRAVHLMSEHIRVPQRNLALSADGEPGAGAPSEERP